MHWGSRKAKTLSRHLTDLKENWLQAATLEMVKQTMRDWKTWRNS
jgi:hypothetical protein